LFASEQAEDVDGRVKPGQGDQGNMGTLPLKLTVTPLLILAASLAIRRWGEIVGGWFVGLPLTSAPVCFFLALDQGAGFAAGASLGCLAGAASEAGFCLLYSIVATHFGWPLALAAGSFGFAIGGLVLGEAGLSLWPLVATACAALAAALMLMPRLGDVEITLARHPRWELPARMVVATALVLGLTALAPYAGARLSGLLATYPVFAAVLTAFSQHNRGAAAGVQVLRGLLIGLFAFAGFFALLASTIERIGIAASFAAATFLALAIQGCSLWLMHRRRAA
jgi:hypothetical protein